MSQQNYCELPTMTFEQIQVAQLKLLPPIDTTVSQTQLFPPTQINEHPPQTNEQLTPQQMIDMVWEDEIKFLQYELPTMTFEQIQVAQFQLLPPIDTTVSQTQLFPPTQINEQLTPQQMMDMVWEDEIKFLQYR